MSQQPYTATRAAAVQFFAENGSIRRLCSFAGLLVCRYASSSTDSAAQWPLVPLVLPGCSGFMMKGVETVETEDS